jgi:hypothetical protein
MHPQAGIIIALPDVRYSGNTESDIIIGLYFTDVFKYLPYGFARERKTLCRDIQVHSPPVIQSYDGRNQETALDYKILPILGELESFQEPFHHIVLHDYLCGNFVFLRFFPDKSL